MWGEGNFDVTIFFFLIISIIMIIFSATMILLEYYYDNKLVPLNKRISTLNGINHLILTYLGICKPTDENPDSNWSARKAQYQFMFIGGIVLLVSLIMVIGEQNGK